MKAQSVYAVTLGYPRASRQDEYRDTVEAVTQAEAKLIAAGRAKQQGWKGAPIKQQAVIVRGEA